MLSRSGGGFLPRSPNTHARGAPIRLSEKSFKTNTVLKVLERGLKTRPAPTEAIFTQAAWLGPAAFQNKLRLRFKQPSTNLQHPFRRRKAEGCALLFTKCLHEFAVGREVWRCYVE